MLDVILLAIVLMQGLGMVILPTAADEVHIHDERKLIKENYGVTFQEIREIDNSATFWYHIFKIPLLVKKE